MVARKIYDLKELSGFDVIVNCTGLGANQLVGDNAVQPLRGQVRPGRGGEGRVDDDVMMSGDESEGSLAEDLPAG